MLRVSCVIRSTEIHPVFFGLLPTFFSSTQSMLLAIFGSSAHILRCPGLHARYTDALNEFTFLPEMAG